jgi:hypothetical protein
MGIEEMVVYWGVDIGIVVVGVSLLVAPQKVLHLYQPSR